MSYLNGTRLHFAGEFQAAVSTVNNDRAHYDAEHFDSSWWQFGAGATNGWWNPPGDGAWRLIGCQITAAFVGDDEPADPADPIFACSVADSDSAAPAKLVDLDCDQQGVSMIFGLTVRIADPGGETAAGGNFAPAPFTNLWQRRPGRGLSAMSAVYQSVLTGVRWPGTAGSAFLEALRAASPDGLLSICFTVDGYDGDHTSSGFTTGRIVGTIGPATATEPRHLVLGRHFMSEQPSPKTLNFCTAVVDTDSGKLRIDLGNALPMTPAPPAASPARAPIADLGPLALTAGDTLLGHIEGYAAPGWYGRTAGVVVLPLDATQLSAAARAPLTLAGTAPGATGASVSEAADGLHVRADRFVYRLDPGDVPTARVFATRFGTPAPGIAIDVALDTSQLASQPETALTFDSPIVTGADGIAPLVLTSSDPGTPRGVIDGQVYAVRPVPADAPPSTVVNPSDFISVLLFSGWKADDPISWNGSLEPIFRQFYALYPVMARFLDLSEYESVCANVRPLIAAFSLPIEDPNAMPVTRDLSTAKRNAILQWLRSNPHGKPLRGEAPPQGHPAARPATVGAGAPGAADQDARVAIKSGKQGIAERRAGGDASS